MSGRLDRIVDWQSVAKAAAFEPQRMAVHCSVTPRHLRRYFITKFGITPRDWAIRLKLQEGVELLARGDSVKEVSVHLGFKQVSHFCRVFKKHYQISPSAFAAALGAGVRE